MPSFFRRFSKLTSKGNESKPKEPDEPTDSSHWHLHDAVTIYSTSVDAHCPGVIVEVDEAKQQITVRYWELNALEIKHKMTPFSAPNVQRRDYESKEDPWNMPIDPPDHDRLAAHHIEAVRDYLSAHPLLFSEQLMQTLDIPRWYTNFQTFLKDKKTLIQHNMFIKLISAYLTEQTQGWLHLFNKYVFTMLIFQQNATGDSLLFQMKMKMLFDILNIGSENIDRDSLGILCILYAKLMVNGPKSPRTPRKSTMSKQQILQRKKRITTFAQNLVDKITAWDSSIDVEEFKRLISESPETVRMLEQSLNAAAPPNRKSTVSFDQLEHSLKRSSSKLQ